jgi:formiminotetrahydrofolate cyclodeaminase
MVCNLTIDKEAFAQNKRELERIKDKATTLQGKLLNAVDEDIRAYQTVIVGYRLPKETEQEKANRRQALQAALKQATEVPYRIAEACLQLLTLCQRLPKLGNPHAISDVAVATHLAEAGAQSALYNVEINCNHITDQSVVSRYHSMGKELAERAAARKQDIQNAVRTILHR